MINKIASGGKSDYRKDAGNERKNKRTAGNTSERNRKETSTRKHKAHIYGPLAHLARAPRLHRGGEGFDSPRVQLFRTFVPLLD